MMVDDCLRANFFSDGAYGETDPLLEIYASRNWLTDFAVEISNKTFLIEGKCKSGQIEGFIFSNSETSAIYLENAIVFIQLSAKEKVELKAIVLEIIEFPESFNFVFNDIDKDIEVVIRHASSLSSES